MPVELFDANFYRSANSDLAAAGLTNEQLLSHFQNFGIDENRLFSPFANINFYRSSNPDLAAAGLNSNRQLYEHLQNFGVAEGRSFSQFANINYYLASNPDVAQAFGNNREQALQHLQINGVNEGRLFSVPFDINYYRSVNSDLVAAGLNNQQLLQHFELNGLPEGRTSSPFFNINYYLANNPDLSAAGINNRQAYDHFLLFGLAEGRTASPFTGGDYAGNTLGTARNIAIEGISTTLRDLVSSSDTEDFYRFSLNSQSNSNLSINGLSANVDVQVFQDFNDNGIADVDEEIAGSFNPDTTTDSLSATLEPGTYYIRVYSVEGANTNYNLSLSATPLAPPLPDSAGNTLLTARDIGTLDGTLSFSDFVGTADTDDFYRFSLNTQSSSTLLLNGLSADADIQVIQDLNNNAVVDDDEIVDSSTSSDAIEESISGTLAAGIYYIRVFQYEGDTNYNLTLSAAPSLEAEV